MLQQNHFALFGLKPAFEIDTARLDQAYRKLQAEVHPDRYATATAQEKLQSLAWATRINEAYQTLKNPLLRARYLLQLHGFEIHEGANTAMPAEFLMQQMEWREAIEDARHTRNLNTLVALNRELEHEMEALKHALGTALDVRGDYASAAEMVCKLRFLEKVRDEIELALEDLEQ
ncbi:MAG: Fe-S protein assembly co-chaperone HscB [Methylophilaceae bacterium]|nr:Fe-S protein assembly co-chaperone HscB [Methylophilaceae bacterium]